MEIGQSSLHQSSISSRKHLKNSIYSSIRKVRRFLQSLRSWYLSRLRLRYGCRSPTLCRGLSSGLKSQLLTASWGVVAFVAAKLSTMADQSGLICLLIVTQTSEKQNTSFYRWKWNENTLKEKHNPSINWEVKNFQYGTCFPYEAKVYGQGNGRVQTQNLTWAESNSNLGRLNWFRRRSSFQ